MNNCKFCKNYWKLKRFLENKNLDTSYYHLRESEKTLDKELLKHLLNNEKCLNKLLGIKEVEND